MKLQGVSIEYYEHTDDEFRPFWTFIIKGISPIHSVGQMYNGGKLGRKLAQERAELIVYEVLTQGE